MIIDPRTLLAEREGEISYARLDLNLKSCRAWGSPSLLLGKLLSSGECEIRLLTSGRWKCLLNRT